MSSPRWTIGVQADIPSIQTWSLRCGLQMLANQGQIELNHITRRLPADSGVWLEVADGESGTTKTIHIDVGDQANPGSPRLKLADSSWARCPVPGSGRPLGLLAPMRTRGQTGLRYLTAATAASIRNRRLRHLWAVRQSLKSFTPPFIDDIEIVESGESKVLYQVTAWNPSESADREGREWLNDRRAALIVALRDGLGERFIGGFVPTDHARQRYPHLVTTFPSGRFEYLELIRQCRIVISGVGLHGSNPWKLAEYLAASRAIIAEPLHSDVPESLDSVIQWFDQPEQCVTICEDLIGNEQATIAQQRNAGVYWRRYVRPDHLLVNRLTEEFGVTEAPHSRQRS